jgi:uncharacterized protein
MFLVPTYVARSATHGYGVYAARPIPAGTRIWEFTPDVDLRLAPEVLEAVPDPLREKLRIYCYQEPDGSFVLCGDNAKFMNHSFEPNCDDVDGPYTITKRDIAQDEELTCDYRLFDLESAQDGLASWRSAS